MKILADSVKPSDYEYMTQLITVERNLEQSNDNYKALVAKKTKLKMKNHELVRLLSSKNGVVMQLEEENSTLRDNVKL